MVEKGFSVHAEITLTKLLYFCPKQQWSLSPNAEPYIQRGSEQ